MSEQRYNETIVSGRKDGKLANSDNIFDKERGKMQSDINKEMKTRTNNSFDSLKQTKQSAEDGGENVITLTRHDGTSEQVKFYNGSKGNKGEKGDKGDKGDKGEVGMQGNSGVADASNKTLVNDAITGGETDFLSAEVGKLGILTYDCSKGGTITHTTLQDAINSVPTTFQKVGLTITYKSGDTIYRYTLKANAWSADPVNWFSVEDKLNDLAFDGALNMLKDAVWENKNIGGNTQLIRLITRDYIPVIAGNEYFIKSNDGYKFRVYTFDKNYERTESDLYDELSLQISDDIICIRIMGQKTNDSEYIKIDESKNFFMSLKNPSSNIYDLQDKAINDKQTLSFIDYFNGKTWINEGIAGNSTTARAKVDALIKVSPLKKYHVFCPDGLAYNLYTYKSTKGDRTESELYSSSSDFTFGEEIAYIRFVARKQDDKAISLDEAAKFKFVEVLEGENVSKTTDLSKRGLHATRNNVAEINGNVVNDNVSWENKNLADAVNLTRITSDYIKIEKDTRYTLQYDSTIINVSPALYKEEGGSGNEFGYGVSSFYSGDCRYLRLLVKNAISGDLTVTVENVIDANIRITPYINKFFSLLDSELNKEYNAFENKYIDGDGNVQNGNDYVMSKKIFTKAKTITWNYSKDAIPFTGSNYGRICAFDAVTNEKLEYWGCQTATRTIDLSSFDWFTATNGFYLVASFFKGYADAKLVMDNETYYPIYPSNLVHSIAHLGLSEIPFHLKIGSYNVATYWHDTKQSDDSYTTKKFTDELKGYLNGFLTGDILFVQEDYTSIKINSDEEDAVDVYETFYKPFFPYASRGHNYWCSIYSKYPLLNARTLKVSDAETSYTPREYALAEISIGGKLIGLASIHGGIKSKAGRQNEFKTLINEMARYDYVIIAGDTNIGIGELNNPSAALEELSIFKENGYTLANGIGFWGENVTGIEDSNNYKGIDNIMVRAFNINSFKIEDSFLDHKPIASDISIIV